MTVDLIARDVITWALVRDGDETLEDLGICDLQEGMVIVKCSGVEPYQRAREKQLEELVRNMWGWLIARTVGGATLYDLSGRMRELGIEVDE